jgi:succinate dehydrogenase / fumarate reductase, flavoprotein subunit
MCQDALERRESAGCHFREEYQTPSGEGRRDDGEQAHVAAWFHTSDAAPARMAREPLVFNHVVPTERNYR